LTTHFRQIGQKRQKSAIPAFHASRESREMLDFPGPFQTAQKSPPEPVRRAIFEASE
jgi:hypothetical protein